MDVALTGCYNLCVYIDCFNKKLSNYNGQILCTYTHVEEYPYYEYLRTDRHDEANSRFSQCCERATNIPVCGISSLGGDF
jgi:hypothetical protein